VGPNANVARSFVIGGSQRAKFTHTTANTCAYDSLVKNIHSLPSRLVVALAVGALTLAACGGGDDDSSPDAAADAPTEAPADAPADAGGACPWAAGEVDLAGFLAEPCFADPYSGDMFPLDPGYITLLPAALTAAGLDADLNAPGPVTLFVPTDAAFNTLLEQVGWTLDELLADTEVLTDVLNQHVVAGDVSATSAVSSDVEVTASTGETMTLSLGDMGVGVKFCGDQMADIVHMDIDVSNGTVHIIDTVLLPSQGCMN
jgi:uncharacterized surface protein with fasciclin (FAS1) repeats